MTTLRRILTISIVLVGLSVAAPAAADSYVGGVPPQLGRVEAGAAPAAAPHAGVLHAASIGGTSSPRRVSGGLAFTGGDVAGLVLIAVIASGFGILLVRVARRPSRT